MNNGPCVEILGQGETGVRIARAVLAHARAVGADAASVAAREWLVARIRCSGFCSDEKAPAERYPAADIRVIVGEWTCTGESQDVLTIAIPQGNPTSVESVFTISTSRGRDYVEEATQAAIGLMESLVLPGLISFGLRDLSSLLSPGKVGAFGWSESDQAPLDAVAAAHERASLQASAGMIYLRCGSSVTTGHMAEAFEWEVDHQSELCNLMVAASCASADTERTRAFLYLSQ